MAPALSDLWKRRTVAAGAAGAAVPVSRELLESAAVRLGLKERQREEERRRWGAFFLGIALGAIAGTIAALLTTPKRGSDVRRELGVRADEVRRELGVKADEIASRAREADWMPVFQREGESGNGHTTSPSTTTVGDVDSPATRVPKPAAAKPRTTSRVLRQPATGTGPAPKPATTPRKKRVDPGSPA